MYQKIKIINSFSKASEEFVNSNVINIYKLAATIERIEQRVNQNKKIA